MLFSQDLSAILLDATALVHHRLRRDGIFIKGLQRDNSGCLMEGEGGSSSQDALVLGRCLLN